MFVSTAEFVLCVLGTGGGRGGGGEGVGSEGGGVGKEPEKVLTLRQLMVQRIDHPSDDVSPLLTECLYNCCS